MPLAYPIVQRRIMCALAMANLTQQRSARPPSNSLGKYQPTVSQFTINILVMINFSSRILEPRLPKVPCRWHVDKMCDMNSRLVRGGCAIPSTSSRTAGLIFIAKRCSTSSNFIVKRQSRFTLPDAHAFAEASNGRNYECRSRPIFLRSAIRNVSGSAIWVECQRLGQRGLSLTSLNMGDIDQGAWELRPGSRTTATWLTSASRVGSPATSSPCPSPRDAVHQYASRSYGGLAVPTFPAPLSNTQIADSICSYSATWEGYG